MVWGWHRDQVADAVIEADLPLLFKQAIPYNPLVSLRLWSRKRGGVSAYILRKLLAVGKGVPNALRIAS